jgi:bacillithiol biosynthesis cysteine-adding enzyme BshC
VPSPAGSSAAGLHDALRAQNARYAPSPARALHLATLRDGGAAVVTGQQVGLFGGPLYTLYKAATAVQLAGALSAQRRQPVAPVFWLQTEDHDLPEVAVCRAPRPAGPPLELTVAEEAAAHGPAGRVSVAHLTLPASTARALDAVGTCVDGLPHAAAHLALLARHYRPGAGWSEAFAGLVAELFAPEGLVLLDPRDPALARAAAPVHRRALQEAGPIAAELAARAESLRAQGRPVQVHVRPRAPLSFFHPRGAAGPRYRLEPTDDGRFAEVGGEGVHSLPSLLAALEEEPLRFSTSALLRPLLQDTLLNTAAYVGGAAELAYLEQLPPLYARFGLPAPTARLRARFRVVDAPARALCLRLGLAPADAAQGEEALWARLGPQDAAGSPVGGIAAAFDRALAEVEPELARAGAAMPTALRKTRSSVRRSLDRLERNYQRAKGPRSDTRAALREFLWRLHPQGVPQERYYGMSAFAAQVGDRGLVERILAAVDPLDASPPERDLEL